MLHQIFIGMLLGWGAAIPIGPINLEVVRRNLRLGPRYGIALGLGACSADVTYLVLLSIGALAILSHPVFLFIIGILGSLILAWFGISALRMQPQKNNETTSIKQGPIYQHTLAGYAMTMLNPMTILFWSSVSTQIATLAHKGNISPIYSGLGVLIGTVSWILTLNIIVKFTRHKLSAKVIHRLNILGGIILLGFAAVGFWHSFQ